MTSQRRILIKFCDIILYCKWGCDMKSDYSEKYIRLGLKIAYYRKLRQGSEAAGR